MYIQPQNSDRKPRKKNRYLQRRSEHLLSFKLVYIVFSKLQGSKTFKLFIKKCEPQIHTHTLNLNKKPLTKLLDKR